MMHLPLAEVMDKEPAAFVLLGAGLAVAIAVFFACRWHRWILLFAIPISILVGVVLTSEIRDPLVGLGIRREAGISYVVLTYVAGALPLIACALCAIRIRSKRNPCKPNHRKSMSPAKQGDWRLTNQDRYLTGVSLQKRPFCIRSEHGKWDHEHCEFCWAKIVPVERVSDDPDFICEAFATPDGNHWVCPKCYGDFKEQFQWKEPSATP